MDRTVIAEDEIIMPLYFDPPLPPIEVPTGIDHYEFFAVLLDSAIPQKGTRQRVTPPKEEDFPHDAPEWIWRCFFVAARALADDAAPPDLNSLRGMAFFGETTEDAERVALAYLGEGVSQH